MHIRPSTLLQKPEKENTTGVSELRDSLGFAPNHFMVGGLGEFGVGGRDRGSVVNNIRLQAANLEEANWKWVVLEWSWPGCGRY